MEEIQSKNHLKNPANLVFMRVSTFFIVKIFSLNKKYCNNLKNPYFMHVSRIVLFFIQSFKRREAKLVKHGKKSVKHAWLRAFFEILTIGHFFRKK